MNMHAFQPMISLGEIAVVNPRGPARGELAADEVCDFLPMAQVSEDGITKVEDQRPYSDVAKGYTAFKNGDVLLAKITPCFENNKIAVASVDSEWAFGSTEFHVIRPSADLDARYLAFFLRQDSVRDAGEKRMTGSGGQRRVPKTFLEELAIPFPPLEEQKRIAAILDQADALRRLRRRALDRLNALGQAIFHEMFVADSATTNFKPLASLGKVITGSTPSTSRDDYFNGDIPFITPGDLEGRDTPTRFLSEAGAAASRTVEAGAAFVCCIGTVGKMGIAKTRSAFNQQINAVEWGAEVMPQYGLYALAQKRDEIIHRGKGAATTLPILKKSTFQTIEIGVAPLSRQRLFETHINKVNEAQLSFERASRREEDLFTSLQHRAFRGEL